MPSSVCSIGFKPNKWQKIVKSLVTYHVFYVLLKSLCKFQISVLHEAPSLLRLKSPCHESKGKGGGEEEGGTHTGFEDERMHIPDGKVYTSGP